MAFHYCTGSLESMSKVDIAKVVLDFFQWQVTQARITESETVNRANAAREANEQARRGWDKEDGFGFGPPMPFSEEYITIAEKDSKKAVERINAMREINKFVRDSLLEKYVQ